MGKRKKKVISGANGEKISDIDEQKIINESQICIGEEIKRWKTVRESMNLSDECLLKAILDLLEDRRVCPHGCYMKSTPVTKERRGIRPKLVRTVGVQTKTKRKTSGMQTEVGSCSEEIIGDSRVRLISQDVSRDTQTYHNELQSNQTMLVTDDERWKVLKASHGIRTDDQMSRALLEWYTQTQTENQISSDMPSQTGTENLQSDRLPSSIPNSSYTLTLSVTPDQEQAIKNLCLLREWPYTKYSPVMEERGPSTERDYKPPTSVIEEDSSVSQKRLHKTDSVTMAGPIKTTEELVSESGNVALRGEGVVELVSRSGEAAVGAVNVLEASTTGSLVASCVDSAVINTATSASADLQTGQNVYIPVLQEDYRTRESGGVYKQMNIHQSHEELQRRENDDIYKTLNTQLLQQRTQTPYVLPNTVALESLGIFPKTTASVIESSGPFTSSTQVEYEPYRRKIDETDPEQNQKYKKIRLTPTTRSVSYPVGSGQESFQVAQEVQYAQIQGSPGYNYLTPGYSQGPGH